MKLWFPDSQERRWADVWSLRLLWLGILYALLWSVLSLQAAQVVPASPGPHPNTQDYINVTESGRISTIENMHIPERLAVLERVLMEQTTAIEEARAEDGSRTKLLFGIMGTLITSLGVQIIQILSNRNHRRSQIK